jgi:LuxR family transcriptional regulator, maltose regulon positive regulatory protein
MRPFRLAPPQPVRGLVTRPRLLALVGQRFERRLMVVVGGAGFGKSTLLAQAVAENRLDPHGVDVWLGCAPDDAAASQLAAGLLAALGADPDPDTADPVSAICAAVWQQAPAEVAVLVDDVHLLPAGSAGAGLLAELLGALPANAHLVLAGRREPALGWARLAATGQVVEVGEAELGFTGAELGEFAGLRQVAAPLLAGVGGWPALAELTAATGHARVADFLWEEVLSPLPAADRRLLAAIAAAGGADEEVAGALAGRPVALAALFAGLPLITRAEGGWHRLHALWEPALARELSPAQVAQARQVAGRVLHQRGEIAAAARLYADAGAWDDLDRLIVDSRQSAYPLVGLDVVGEWLHRLPSERRSQPTAWLLEATLLLASDLPAARARLLDAADSYRAAGELAGEIACLSRLALISWWQRDQAAIASLLPRVIELAAASVPGPAGDSLAALSTWARVVAAELRGDTAAAIRVLESITITRFSPDWQAVLDLQRVLQHLAVGDPGTALVFAERAIVNAAITARQSAFSLALTCLYLLGRHGEVLQRLPDMFADPQMTNENAVAAHAVAAFSLAWAGQLAQAAEHLREAEQAGRALSTPMVEVFLTEARLALALARGEQADAVALAGRLRRLCGDQPSVARLVDRIFVAVQYVLLPATRPWWDAQPLEGCFVLARELGRALVAVRAGEAVDRSRLPAIAMIRAFLPPAWVGELVGDDLVAGSAAIPEVPVHLRLLGPVQLLRGEVAVVHPHLRRQRVRELLAYLVLHHGATRQSIAADLWPDLTEAAAARNLRVQLNYLTQLLEPPDTPRDRSLLRRTGNRIELVEGPQLTTDVWTIERLLDQAAQAERHRAPSMALTSYQQAVAEYRGPLLADTHPPDWLLPHRERLQRHFAAAAIRAGDLLIATGAVDEPLRLARLALAADPSSEPAHQLLISAHLAADDRHAARLALDDCTRMLDALAAPPDRRTLMLTRKIRGTPAPATTRH